MALLFLLAGAGVVLGLLAGAPLTALYRTGERAPAVAISGLLVGLFALAVLALAPLTLGATP